MSAGPAVVSPPPDPPVRARRRWLLPAAAAAWAVLLLVLAYLSARDDAPTVREQRDLVAAERVAREAAGQLVAALGPGAVLELTGFREQRCDISPVRAGASARLDVVVHPPAGGGAALLDRVAAALPASYRTRLYAADGTNGRELTADAGDFVGVSAEVSPEDDVVVFAVSTGCRPLPGLPRAAPAIGVPLHPEQQRLVAALGGPRLELAESWQVVPCPDGGRAQTRALTLRSTPVDPGTAMRTALAGRTAVRSGPDVYAYQVDSTSVVAELVEGGLRIAATSGCRG